LQGKVAILLHGMYQHKNINMLRPFGARIAEDPDMNLSTFRFDCRGLGESEGTTSYTPHYINLADLRSAVAYLAAEHALVPEVMLNNSTYPRYLSVFLSVLLTLLIRP
jgi:alpha/beta superfamily hydrolase